MRLLSSLACTHQSSEVKATPVGGKSRSDAERVVALDDLDTPPWITMELVMGELTNHCGGYERRVLLLMGLKVSAYKERL